MSYEVLARKYRPQTFSGLTGQDHVSQTLKNAIEGGRVAHAFLFTGARGVGKTSSARILAKALNCEQGPASEPCNQCANCKEITDGTCTDVFEIDGASNTGVDDIRELRDNSRYAPSHCRYKIYIIDEVHMLSNNAFNALLKTLEEPPPHVKFIFATTEPHKLPITILSRCQRFDFKRVPLNKIVARLKEITDTEQISVSESALTMIARKGDGSMRDAITALDQVLAFCGSTVDEDSVTTLLGVVDRTILYTLAQAIFSHNQQQLLEINEQVRSVGYSIRQFTQELIEFFRAVLIVSAAKQPELLLDIPSTELERLKVLASESTPYELERHCSLLLKAEGGMGGSSFQHLHLELALLKMSQLQPIVPVPELLDRIKHLETGLATKSGSLFAQSTTSQVAARPQPTASSPQDPPPQKKEENRWEKVVQHSRSKKPSVAAILEHGTPLRLSEETIEIGFPEQSYYLTAMQDTATLESLRDILQEYLGQAPRIIITAMGNSQPETLVDSSIAEKKKTTEIAQQESMEQTIEKHPCYQSLVSLLGAETIEINPAPHKKRRIQEEY